eukprot:3151647-Amphidinium_carterae.1
MALLAGGAQAKRRVARATCALNPELTISITAKTKGSQEVSHGGDGQAHARRAIAVDSADCVWHWSLPLHERRSLQAGDFWAADPSSPQHCERS